MTNRENADKIVRDALKDMMAEADLTVVASIGDAAIGKLGQLNAQDQAEQDYFDAGVMAIANQKIKIGTNNRAEALASLLALAASLADAAKKMDKASANNILSNIATVGNNVLDVASSVQSLAETLKKIGEDEADVDAATLSSKINDTLDKIHSLKSL